MVLLREQTNKEGPPRPYPENIDNQFGGFQVLWFQLVADIDRFLPTIHWASDQVLVSENLDLRFR